MPIYNLNILSAKFRHNLSVVPSAIKFIHGNACGIIGKHWKQESESVCKKRMYSTKENTMAAVLWGVLNEG